LRRRAACAIAIAIAIASIVTIISIADAVVYIVINIAVVLAAAAAGCVLALNAFRGNELEIFFNLRWLVVLFSLIGCSLGTLGPQGAITESTSSPQQLRDPAFQLGLRRHHQRRELCRRQLRCARQEW